MSNSGTSNLVLVEITILPLNWQNVHMTHAAICVTTLAKFPFWYIHISDAIKNTTNETKVKSVWRSHFCFPPAEPCVDVINKCCYVSASAVQVSELMQQRSSVWMHNSSLSSMLSMPLFHFLSCIIFHDFQKAPHITHPCVHTSPLFSRNLGA